MQRPVRPPQVARGGDDVSDARRPPHRLRMRRQSCCQHEHFQLVPRGRETTQGHQRHVVCFESAARFLLVFSGL